MMDLMVLLLGLVCAVASAPLGHNTSNTFQTNITQPLSGGVQFSRKVNTVAPGTIGSIKISNGNCQSSDTWGSNNCDFSYGSTLGLSFNLSFPFSIYATFTITISGKITAGPFISKDVSFKCAACGSPCNIDPPSPFSSFGISFPTPACPFTTWSDSFSYPVPDVPDIPFAPNIDFAGSVSLTDTQGDIQDEVDITVSASA